MENEEIMDVIDNMITSLNLTIEAVAKLSDVVNTEGGPLNDANFAIEEAGLYCWDAEVALRKLAEE